MHGKIVGETCLKYIFRRSYHLNDTKHIETQHSFKRLINLMTTNVPYHTENNQLICIAN